MLVLSRRVGEELLIDGKVRVVVLQTRGGQVRLGIQAPREVPVLRKELLPSAGAPPMESRSQRDAAPCWPEK